MSVLAIIPARSGSKGIPGKNTRPLAGGPCAVWRAAICALDAHVSRVIVSSDVRMPTPDGVEWLQRPATLAKDETPMIDVVRHVLAKTPGPDDQIVLLVQPTQPLRKPSHLTAAIARLRTGDWDAVVSITPIARTHAPEYLLMYDDTDLTTSPWFGTWGQRPTRRQSVPTPYIADGTVYAFRRRNLARYDTMYGHDVSGLVIPPDETCSLDTLDDWAALERRLTV